MLEMPQLSLRGEKEEWRASRLQEEIMNGVKGQWCRQRPVWLCQKWVLS